MDRSHHFRWLWFLTWGLCAGFSVVAVRLVHLQLISPQDSTPSGPGEPEVVMNRPALRGEIRDASGITLVQSRLAVVVRADPVLLGPFSEDVARIAAPILALPESEVLSRLQPIYFPYTNLVVLTNGPVVSTNRQVVTRARRANMVATNISVEAWDRLMAALDTNRFTAEIALRAEREQLKERQRVHRETLAWWNLPARWQVHRAELAESKGLRIRKRDLDQAAAQCRRRGFFPEYVHLRRYPQDQLAAHVLGFTTNDTSVDLQDRGLPPPMRGAQGLEQRCDAILQGKPGILRTRMVHGREYVPSRGRDLAPTDGMTVVLTLDVRIQEAVEQALDTAMERLNPASMTAIVVRPATGDILALANRPTFNPSNRKGESAGAFKNRALTESFEPGSTFKIVTWSAALNEEKATLSEMINCHGGHWPVPGIRRTIHDDQGHHLGIVSVEEAFANSSNVGAVQLALRLQTNQFLKYIRDFGFLARTDIECAERWTNRVVQKDGRANVVLNFGESAGRLPSWDGYTPSSLGFGYALRVTPLQSVMAVAALANGGVLMKPRLVRKVLTADGQPLWDYPPQAVRSVVRSNTAAMMVQAMRKAVEEGTGKTAALEDFEVAGKTGTARKSVGQTYDASHYYASFVGFFPANHPEVAIIVTADEPTTAGKSYYGGKACAPVFKEIASAVANVLQLAPTLIRTNDATASFGSPHHGVLARQP